MLSSLVSRRLWKMPKSTRSIPPTVIVPALRFEWLEDRTTPSTLTVGSGHQYATISAAVAAAPANAAIEVFPGVYNETVTIAKNGIQLVAEGPGVIVQPTTATPLTLASVNVGAAAIDIYGSNVVVNGFTVNGGKDTDGNLWAGIRVIEGGSATIENNTVENIDVAPASTDADVGIQVGDALVSGSLGGGTAKIINNTVVSYSGAGVLVDGADSTATVAGNTITGLGSANGGISEYGIQASYGASAQLLGNTIKGNTIEGYVAGGYNPAPTSAGIFIFDDGNSCTSVTFNTVTDNDDGILVQSSAGTSCDPLLIGFNTVEQNYAYAGIFVLSSNNVTLLANTVTNNSTWNGIALNGSSQVQVVGNMVGNNVNADGIYDYQGNNNQIVFNASHSNGNNGINLDTTTGDLVSQNATWNNAYSGIQVIRGSGNSIQGNVSSGNTQNGIVLIDTADNFVEGNVLTQNGRSGVQLEDAQNTLITGNAIRDNSGGTIASDSLTSGTVAYNNNPYNNNPYNSNPYDNGPCDNNPYDNNPCNNNAYNNNPNCKYF